MNIEKSLLTFIVLIILSHAQDPTTLGTNLLINHDFSMPNISSLGVNHYYFSRSILGWNCSTYCEVVDCYRLNWQLQYWNTKQFAGDCPSQAIDTSSFSNDVISQIFEAQAGDHVLDVKFLTPISFARRKILVVMINQQIIYKFHPHYEDFNYKQISMSITLLQGLNNISFKTEGLDHPSGFRIFEVKIRRKISPQVTKTIDIATDNVILSNAVAIPYSRILFGELMNTMISVDRLQLYYYHHRRYSYYYDIFLKGITNLLNQKGTYATLLSDSVFSFIGTSEQSMLQSINYKKDRKHKDGFAKDNFLQNGGFFFMVSTVPIAFLIFFIFHILFKITFNNKFSKILRKFSFFSLILLMLFEGNIQQFSFLIIDQFLEYFSANFTHKVVNILIAIIFYLILFCSSAYYLYCWHIHSKKMSYLTDNACLNISGMMAYTFDRGLMCVILGSTHRLTLLLGKQQLLALAAVQMFLIASKTIFLLYTSYKCKRVGWISVLECLIRISFQMSLFLYEDSGDLSGFINEIIHLRIIYAFLLLWSLNFIVSAIEAIKQSVPPKEITIKPRKLKIAKSFTSKVQKSAVNTKILIQHKILIVEHQRQEQCVKQQTCRFECHKGRDLSI